MDDLPALWLEHFAQVAGGAAEAQTALARVNERVAGHGLTLRPEEVRALALRREELLQSTGRVEFGEGVLPKLAFAFCDSPNIAPENYEATLEELLECFYHFKNQTREAIGDDELLAYMKRQFDGVCQGSVEYLAGTLLEDLARGVRFGGLGGAGGPGEAEPEEDWPDEEDEDDM